MDAKKKAMAAKSRKEKSSMFPSCKVCDGPGNGIHYGVNTCDACKGFFHRSLRLHDQYTCIDDKRRCPIQFGIGKMCQLCRYEKCLAMGLSKDAIKKGRYTAEKKTEFILQAKRIAIERLKREQAKRAKLQQDELSDGDVKSEINEAIGDRKGKSSVLDFIRPRIRAMIRSGLTSASASSPSAGSSTNNGGNAQSMLPSSLRSPAEDPSNSPDSSFDHTKMRPNLDSINHNQSPSSSSAAVSSSASSLSSLSSWALASASLSTSPPSDNSKQRNVPSVDDLASPHSRDYYVSSSSTPTERCVRSACDDSWEGPTSSTSPEDPRDSRGYYKDVHTINTDSELVSRLYEDPDEVRKTLVEAHKVSMIGHSWTKEEAARESAKHHDRCMLRKEVFGRLGSVSDDEFNQIYEETGIDVDGRLGQFAEFADCVEKCIRRMIKFVTAIPGFHALDMDEKISLVKYGRLEFSMISNYVYANLDLGVVRCMSITWLCAVEAFRYNAQETFQSYLEICARLQAFELTEEERIILTAMSAMTPRDPDNSGLMQHIRWRLSEMFMNNLKKNHPSSHLLYMQVMEALRNFRQLEKGIISCVQNCIMHKFNLLSERPLVKEMVTDFYIGMQDMDDHCCSQGGVLWGT